jgi:hypothetical protein
MANFFSVRIVRLLVTLEPRIARDGAAHFLDAVRLRIRLCFKPHLHYPRRRSVETQPCHDCYCLPNVSRSISESECRLISHQRHICYHLLAQSIPNLGKLIGCCAVRNHPCHPSALVPHLGTSIGGRLLLRHEARGA